MGFWRQLLSGRTDPVFDAAPDQHGPSFAIDGDSIDPAVFGLTAYASPVSPAPRIDRRSAMQVPAVKRSRDLIAGTLGGLPIDLFGGDKTSTDWQLFRQPEANVPRSVTMTRLFEDLLFEQIAWWKVLERDYRGYPSRVKRLAPHRVTVDEDQGRVYVDGQHVSDREIIRFDSPNDGLLFAGARAIRTCLALDSATSRYADGAPPLDYFTPAEGADPVDDDEIVEFLGDWQSARQLRSTGYVPAALKYNIGGWNPEQLQLADARQHAVLEIARLAGVDPEELGVSTTSRTYANQQDRRKAFLDFTLGGYRSAIEDRLSMGDVSPRGYYARFNLSAFLRSDDKTRMETYRAALDVGAITQDEIRDLEDKPALSPSERPALRALPAPTEESA